jgi:DNA end-binding protein Ku
MQAIWKGQISFGLVTIPVSLYSATDEKTISFRQLHEKDMSRIRYRKVCEDEDVEVEGDEIVKGYEISKGQYVVLTDDDFQKVEPELTKTIDMVNFIKLDEIDPMWLDKPYFLEPRDGGGTPYELMRRTLEDMGYVGIAKTVLRNREHLAALIPHGKILILNLMRFSDEIRSPDKLDMPKKVKIEEKHMELARELIQRMASEFKYEEYIDEYEAKLKEMIRQKAEGREVEVPAPVEVPEIESLMEALERSLERVPS